MADALGWGREQLKPPGRRRVEAAWLGLTVFESAGLAGRRHLQLLKRRLDHGS
jgi:hypothetical protein